MVPAGARRCRWFALYQHPDEILVGLRKPYQLKCATNSSQSVLVSKPLATAGHLPALDGLRGIAILLVMGRHILETFPGGPAIPDAVTHLASFGWVGVDLFFVLSGFLITGILYDTKSSPGFFRNFYIRRVLRIFPLYYGFLVLLCLVLPPLDPDDSAKIAELHRACPWYWSYLANFYMAQHRFGPLSTTHLWSLSVEEQFYLMWPAIVFLLAPRNLLRLCAAAIVGAVLCRIGFSHFGASASMIYVMLPTRVDSLAMGGLIALIARSPSGAHLLERAAPITAGLTAATLLSLLILAAPSNLDSAPFMQNAFYTLNAVLFGGVLTLALTRRPVQRRLGSPLLRFFGRHSYALYLVHPLVYGVFQRLTLSGALAPLAGLPRAVQVASWVTMNVAVAVVLSVIAWYGVERPFLRLKTRFPTVVATLVSAP
jgi:peptidoglycan/LPS O-acetylase OafA/YrhL